MTSTSPLRLNDLSTRGGGEPGKPRWNNGLRRWGGTVVVVSRWTKTNIIREVVATGGPPGGATEVQIDGMGMGWGWHGGGMGDVDGCFFFPRKNILGNLGSCSVFLFSCLVFFLQRLNGNYWGFKKGHVWKEQERKHLYLLTYCSQVQFFFLKYSDLQLHLDPFNGYFFVDGIWSRYMRAKKSIPF